MSSEESIPRESLSLPDPPVLEYAETNIEELATRIHNAEIITLVTYRDSASVLTAAAIVQAADEFGTPFHVRFARTTDAAGHAFRNAVPGLAIGIGVEPPSDLPEADDVSVHSDLDSEIEDESPQTTGDVGEGDAEEEESNDEENDDSDEMDASAFMDGGKLPEDASDDRIITVTTVRDNSELVGVSGYQLAKTMADFGVDDPDPVLFLASVFGSPELGTDSATELHETGGVSEHPRLNELRSDVEDEIVSRPGGPALTSRYTSSIRYSSVYRGSFTGSTKESKAVQNDAGMPLGVPDAADVDALRDAINSRVSEGDTLRDSIPPAVTARFDDALRFTAGGYGDVPAVEGMAEMLSVISDTCPGILLAFYHGEIGLESLHEAVQSDALEIQTMLDDRDVEEVDDSVRVLRIDSLDGMMTAARLADWYLSEDGEIAVVTDGESAAVSSAAEACTTIADELPDSVGRGVRGEFVFVAGVDDVSDVVGAVSRAR